MGGNGALTREKEPRDRSILVTEVAADRPHSGVARCDDRTALPGVRHRRAAKINYLSRVNPQQHPVVQVGEPHCRSTEVHSVDHRADIAGQDRDDWPGATL